MPADTRTMPLQIIGEYHVTSGDILGISLWEFFIEHLEVEKMMLEVF